MKPLHVLLALGAIGLPAVAVASSRPKSTPVPQPPPPPPPPDAAAIGEVAPEHQASPVGERAPPPEPGGPTGGELLVQGGKALLGSGVGATIELGLKSLQLQEAVVGALGANEATQDAVRVFGHVASVGFVAQQGLERVADVVGIDKETGKDIGQVGGIAAAAGLVLGAPAVLGVAGIKLAAEGVSAAIGAIAGEEAEKAVRGAVSELDPFRTGSAANQAIATIGNAIFGERPKAPPPPPPVISPAEMERIRIQAENNERAAATAAAAREKTLARAKKGGRSRLDE